MRRRLFLYALFYALLAPLFTVPVAYAGTLPDKGDIYSLTVENDSLGGNSDRHYTSGVRASVLFLHPEIPTLVREAAGQYPLFKTGEASAYMFSVGQNLYTPANITVAAPQPNDRPWAGFFYVSAALNSGDSQRLDTLEMTAGMVGPAALGEPTQKTIHHAIGSPQPQGWDNQLKDEPALMVSWQRRWPSFGYLPLGPLEATASPYVATSLGNVFTYGGAGMSFRLGSHTDGFTDLPLRVRPGVPGTSYFHSPKHVAWYLFANVEARAVARNIFLDGNTFTAGPHVDKNTMVYDGSAGAALTWRRWQLSYTLNHRSREFKGQTKADIFGAVNLSMKF